MKKLCVFPYNHDAKTLLERRGQLKGFEISAVIPFKSDAAAIGDLSKKHGVKFTSDINAVAEADALLLCDNIHGFALDGYIDAAQNAQRLGKEIFLSVCLNNELRLDGERELQNGWDNSREYTSGTIFDVDVPIIAVLGMGENTGKFDAQLRLCEHMRNKGYNVLHICSNPLEALLGACTLPPFMFDKTVSFPEKIIRFNHAVYDAVKKEKPDAVVIGMPGGIMPFNEYHSNYFGELALVISNALAIDAGIFTTYLWTHVTEQFFNEIKALCEKKMGVPADCFCVSSQQYFFDDESKRLSYRFFDESFVKSHYPSLEGVSHTVFRLEDGEGAAQAFEGVLESLEENVSVL